MTIRPALVSDEVFDRISTAIDEISSSEVLKRTKRQIEDLAALSHATVARAFAQDLLVPTHHTINERFNALQRATGGLSPRQSEERSKDRDLEKSRKRIKTLEEERAIHLQTIYALWLAAQPDEPAAPVVRIRRPRSPHRP